MKVFRLAAALLALFVTALPVMAAPVVKVNAGLQDVIDTVEKSFKPDKNTGLPPLSTVTADFFQRSTMTGKEREMRADGQMYFKTATSREPLMFRFDYFRPLKQEIVTDGRTLWMYLPENRQVILSDVTPVFNPFTFDSDRDRASNFLQGLPRISRDFLIVFSPQGQDIEGNYVLELTPRRATASIAKLFIVVPREAVLSYVQSGRTAVSRVSNLGRQEWPFPILSTTMVDHQGSTTLMEFSNVRTNMMLSDSLFTFAVPPGVQVVKPPRKK